MDFSKEYVMMCEKAKEIDRLWTYVVGDFYYDKSAAYINREGRSEGGVSVMELKTFNDIIEGAFMRSKAIWLPRQDQLQEMVNLTEPEEAIQKIKDFYEREKKEKRDFYKTMEQLWLAFVMKARYNKKWEEGEWENI